MLKRKVTRVWWRIIAAAPAKSYGARHCVTYRKRRVCLIAYLQNAHRDAASDLRGNHGNGAPCLAVLDSLAGLLTGLWLMRLVVSMIPQMGGTKCFFKEFPNLKAVIDHFFFAKFYLIQWSDATRRWEIENLSGKERERERERSAIIMAWKLIRCEQT